MIRAAAMLVSCVAFASCNALPTEQRLIGTWRVPVHIYYNEFGKVKGYSQQMAETTVRPDHTYTAIHQGVPGAVTGRWRLSGRWLVYEFTTRAKGRRIVERHRNMIIRLSDRKLVIANRDGGDSEWTKVR